MDDTKQVRLLDKTRDYGILGCGDQKFHSQDGRVFDIGTDEEVDLDALPKTEPEPEVPSVLTCKFCEAKRETPELMREHLLALHREDIEKDKAEKAEVTEQEESKPLAPELKELAGLREKAASINLMTGEETARMAELEKKVEKIEKAMEDKKIVPVTAADVLHKKEPCGSKKGRKK